MDKGLFILSWSALAIFTECSPAQFVPDNYTEEVHTGAPIESKYLRNGTMEVGVFEQEVEEVLESIVIYYPVEMTRLQKKYPVVVFVNGTGVTASKYAFRFCLSQVLPEASRRSLLFPLIKCQPCMKKFLLRKL